MELNKRACIGNIIMRDVGKFTQSKPGNRFRAPMGAVPREVLYTFRCRRRIAAHFAMQMKSKRSQIDNTMGSTSILYLQMGFGMSAACSNDPNDTYDELAAR
ncbi:hypothetical protein JTB14_013142 [Gonioctena quinquepunctata]|nr:hypothetical protein JTB14_013142 [Gonioctena quinquepunctata]